MKRLLVVDDHEENLYLLQVLLESQGYVVELARNGAEALEKARRHPPDLIISDILMPVMDGFTLCRTWKADEQLGRIPLIFYTATYTDPKDEQFALEIGADAFITKPAEPEAFMAAVSAVLARAEAGRLSSGSESTSDDEGVLRQYSEVLVRKLEDKMLQLEKANEALEREVAERQLAEDALLRQVAFDEVVEGLLSKIASASAMQIEGYITSALQPIADFMGVDSVIVFQTDEDLTSWGATYSWAAPGMTGVHERLASVPMGTLPRLEDELLAGKAVILRSPDDLPPEADELRELWDAQGLKSALIVPLRGRGDIVRGALALFAVTDSPAWRQQDVRQAEQVGEAIASVLERKRAEDSLRLADEKLRQSQKMEAIGQLAGGIAHDFNNLLTAIIGYSDLALDQEARGIDEILADVREIRAAAERAGSLTRQILAFSRRQVLRPLVLSLNEVLIGLEPLLRRTLGENVDLRLSLAVDLAQIEVDPSQMEQVLLNLAVNARDAMPTGGSLTLETANVEIDHRYVQTHPEVEPGFYVMLAVSDSGCGMETDTLAHIFEPFFTTKGLGRGTGLGLSTVFGIVQQSGGSISVYSEPGRGTSFKVYLPRADKVATRSTEVVDVSQSLSGSESILVVEDEEGVRNVVERVLKQLGYAVIAVGNGDEALSVLKGDLPVDLLLTDMVLPGSMQGGDLVQAATLLRPSLPVLHMSGYTRDAIVHAGRVNPGVNYIEKPFGPGELARRVREALDAGVL